jgi:hypothetical protein
MKRLGACLAAVMVTSALAARSPAAPVRTGSKTRAPAAVTASDAAGSVAEVTRLVRALDATPELSKSTVEAVLGAKLERPKDAQQEHEYVGVLRSGPFSAVRLRYHVAIQSQDPGSAILVLDVRPGLCLERRAFDIGFIGSRVLSEPLSYRGPQLVNVVSGQNWRRRFAFRLGTTELLSVAFHRGRAAAPPP